MQMPLKTPAVLLRFLTLLCLAAVGVPQAGLAADRERVEAFLEVTGFDVALDSIALSASSAPEMLGVDAGAFGSQGAEWSGDVVDTGEMGGLVLESLEVSIPWQKVFRNAD